MKREEVLPLAVALKIAQHPSVKLPSVNLDCQTRRWECEINPVPTPGHTILELRYSCTAPQCHRGFRQNFLGRRVAALRAAAPTSFRATAFRTTALPARGTPNGTRRARADWRDLPNPCRTDMPVLDFEFLHARSYPDLAAIFQSLIPSPMFTQQATRDTV